MSHSCSRLLHEWLVKYLLENHFVQQAVGQTKDASSLMSSKSP